MNNNNNCKELGPYQITKKVMEHESDGDPNYNWCTRNGSQRFSKGTGRAGNRSTFEMFQTTEFLRSIKILRRVLET